MILEALLARASLLLLPSSEFWLKSDKEMTHQNYITPFIALFIFRVYWFELKGFVYSEAA